MVVFASSFLQLICILTILGIVDSTNRFAVSATDYGINSELEENLFPLGYTYYPEIATAYKLYTTKLSWSNARLACESDGARLALLDTHQKIAYITSQRQWGQFLWTGIFKTGIFSSWISVSGEQLPAQLPWVFLGNLRFLGNCAAVSGLNSGLCVKPCFIQKMFVCEIPAVQQILSFQLAQKK